MKMCPSVGRQREGVHAQVVLYLRVARREAVAEDAAERRAVGVRDGVDPVFARQRVELVDAVHQIVADVDHAVRVQQEVVHLRQRIADGPLGDLYAGEVRLPRLEVRQQLGVVADRLEAPVQVARQRLAELVRHLRAVAVHAVDHVAPFLARAGLAHERRGLLVAERAVQQEVLARAGIAVEVEQREPQVRRLGFRQRERIGLRREQQFGRLVAADALHARVGIARLAHAQVHQLGGGLETHLARRVAEARELRRSLVHPPRFRVAVVGGVGGCGAGGAARDHRAGHGHASGVAHGELDRAGAGAEGDGADPQYRGWQSHASVSPGLARGW